MSQTEFITDLPSHKRYFSDWRESCNKSQTPTKIPFTIFTHFLFNQTKQAGVLHNAAKKCEALLKNTNQ